MSCAWARNQERRLSDEFGTRAPGSVQRWFGAGIEDVVILPLVLIALAARYLFKAALSLLIHILDYAFPILLQLARFPLFTVRIVGDGVAALLKGVVGWLPLSGTSREAWRVLVSRWWAWLRQKVSYKAFEEALHHAFERGMAWVFRTCRDLTPGGALLVIAGAVLWLPVSFVAATAMHAVLIAKAASLPAWMQLLHALATVVAKSKLLVLPVYPAAWPQARKHALVRATFRFSRYVARRHLVQKTAWRYRQAEHAAVAAAAAMGRAAARAGVRDLSNAALAALDRLVMGIGHASRVAAMLVVGGLSMIPLVGSIVRRYVVHYAAANRQPPERFSDKARRLFERWSIKFSAEYYEAKEKTEAARRDPRA
jgi:hypothetical protein